MLILVHALCIWYDKVRGLLQACYPYILFLWTSKIWILNCVWWQFFNLQVPVRFPGWLLCLHLDEWSTNMINFQRHWSVTYSTSFNLLHNSILLQLCQHSSTCTQVTIVAFWLDRSEIICPIRALDRLWWHDTRDTMIFRHCLVYWWTSGFDPFCW